MMKNLETADKIMKLVLSVTTVILFFAGVIAGSFAELLVVLSVGVIVTFFLRLLLTRGRQRNT